MKKKLLMIGYHVPIILGIDNITFSRYSLSFSSEKRWQNKLVRIEKYIENNELQCILIVVCKNFIDEVLTLDDKRFTEFISVCKKTNCIIAIQEYLLEEKPLFYDFYEDRKYTVADLQKKVDELEYNISIKSKISHESDERVYSLPNYSVDKIPTGVVMPQSISSEDYIFINDLTSYQRKLKLLKETSDAFPRIKKILKILKTHFVDIITFQYLNQVSDLVKNEIVEKFSNEILNIYISKQYGYRFEFDDFIQLFEKYLKNIEQLKISIEIDETSLGINYRFISKNNIESLNDLPSKFNRFTQFIDLCEKEPETALQILENKNISAANALEIIQRLSKKYKRLLLDIKQQQERLELSLKQEVQSELLEMSNFETPFSMVQKSFSIKSLDNIYYPNDDDLNLIKIVKKYGNNINVSNINSDIEIIKDTELKPEVRRKSAYKIKKLLTKIVGKGLQHAERIAVESLLAYIKSKID